MSEIRVAKRYSKALLDLAIETKSLDKIYKDIELLSKVCSENRDFELALKSPIVKFDKKKAILNQILKGKVEALTLSFIDIICNKNRASVLPAIAKEFTAEYKIYMGIQSASVTTAIKLDKKTTEEITDLVMQISGKKKVELTENVDKDIIGGYILKVGDQQINESISGKLKDLKLRLTDKRFEKKF